MDPISKLTKDLREAARTLESEEARFLVDYYYTMQGQRIRTGNQIRSMSKARKENGRAPEPSEVIRWLEGNMGILERNIKAALKEYASALPAGRWAMARHGIGPVISAGLLAHVDVNKAKSPSSVWRFAGLDPTSKWGKGEKRPWNARLKTLCWHAGESFKRTSGSPKTFYGKIYRERKELEVQRNEDGLNAEVAARTLEERNIGKTTEAYGHYSRGKLPPARLDLRATRVAVKVFLSHFWVVLYETTFGKKAPAPWVIEHGGHVDLIEVPGYVRLES